MMFLYYTVHSAGDIGFEISVTYPCMIKYDIFLKLQLGCHLVAVVQYTFTHNNTQNDTK